MPGKGNPWCHDAAAAYGSRSGWDALDQERVKSTLKLKLDQRVGEMGGRREGSGQTLIGVEVAFSGGCRDPEVWRVEVHGRNDFGSAL